MPLFLPFPLIEMISKIYLPDNRIRISLSLQELSLDLIFSKSYCQEVENVVCLALSVMRETGLHFDKLPLAIWALLGEKQM